MSKIKWLIPLIIGLIVGTSVYFVANAFFFVQRSHERVDSLVQYLIAEGYTVFERPHEEFADPYVVDDCGGDDGLFLTTLVNSDATVINYGKTNVGAFMWFFIDDYHVVWNYHKLW